MTEMATIIPPVHVSKYTKDGMLKEFANSLGLGSQQKRTNKYWFWSDGIKQTQESIDLLAEPQAKRTPLWKIGRKIYRPGRFDFWRMVFENRERIPKEELLAVWYDCLRDAKDPYHTQVETPDEMLEFKFRPFYPKNKSSDERKKIKDTFRTKLAGSVFTNHLLIDNLTARFRYIQAKKNGWKMLRHTGGGRIRKLDMPRALYHAIWDDDVPVFNLYLDLCRKKVSVCMVEGIIRYGGPNILGHLLKENMIKPNVFSLPELCCFIVSQFGDSKAIPLLTALETYTPGLLKSVHDAFGRNLLWYMIYNMNTAWFHPDCKLTPFLLKHGCDPLNQNQLGMSWQFVTDNLSLRQKLHLLEMCYKYSKKEYALKDEQPIERIMETQK